MCLVRPDHEVRLLAEPRPCSEIYFVRTVHELLTAVERRAPRLAVLDPALLRNDMCAALLSTAAAADTTTFVVLAYNSCLLYTSDAADE